MLIREYHANDLEAMADLMGDLGYPMTLVKMKRQMEVIVSNPSYSTFMAVKETQVVGMIGTRDIYYYEDEGFVIQISLLVAKKELQGQGIGSALLDFVEQWALARGAASLYLTSGNKPERQKAHELYIRKGFEINGSRFVKKLVINRA